MRRAVTRLCLATAALAGGSTWALALGECSITSSPSVPTASVGAFGDDVRIDATGHVSCQALGIPMGALNACIAARKELVSGSTGFSNGSTTTIAYALTINSVSVGDSDTQVFAGTVPSTGLDLPVSYLIRSEDYAGTVEGNYDAIITWTINHDPAICP